MLVTGLAGCGLSLAGCGGEMTPAANSAVNSPAAGTVADDRQPAPTPSAASMQNAPHPVVDGIPDHLRDALEFADAIGAYGTQYVRGGSKVIWPGIKGGPMCRTDCSGFVNAVLTHSLGYQQADFKPWFGVDRPLAKDWYAAIDAERGFVKTTQVERLLPGDFLVVKFPAGGEVTGHCMLIASTPKKWKATAPLIDGTTQWDVVVIDASKTPHGKGDTRYLALKPLPPRDPNMIEQRDMTIEPIEGPPPGADPVDATGLGKGTLRLYADKDGNIAGYAWSDSHTAKFKSVSDYKILGGQWKTGFDPHKAPAGAGQVDRDAGD